MVTDLGLQLVFLQNDTYEQLHLHNFLFSPSALQRKYKQGNPGANSGVIVDNYLIDIDSFHDFKTSLLFLDISRKLYSTK